ncbi:MAG: indolepyruvate ferredoxin oxidoreductase subunit alpha [Phycisphaerae bacterium]|nr:indolepyruvate ferredoxin oxidoreductase subunit alpha [Phycisphaerae bacterium]
MRVLLSGNEAVARGAWEAGVAVACAYPGTPSTEILENVALYPEIDAQWSVNEKVAYEVALGAAMGGRRSLFACKHVGLNVAMDPLMTSSYTGISGGFVVVVCDDPQMHSSQNEQDTRWVGIFGKLPVLEPAGPGEAREFVKEAFAISEEYDTPVLLRMTTRVSHTKEDVEISERVEVEPRPFVRDVAKYVMIPKNARGRHVVVEARMARLQALAERMPCNRVEEGCGKLGFVTAGVSYNYVKEAYPEASVLKLGMAYPFCDEKIAEFAGTVEQVVVVEELDPFIEDHLKALGIAVTAKDASFRIGELGTAFVRDIVEGKKKHATPVTARKPLFCAGCPHRFAFVVLKKMRVYVAGDIGCYALASLPPLSSLHTCICMGTGVTLVEGLGLAMRDERVVGVLGDSTFVHSGITGLINAAYNKAKGVVVILDNSITAMTGGQQNPTTGLTIRNEPTKKLDLEKLCQSCGADNVDVIDHSDIAAFEKLVTERLAEDALSVIIARSPCKMIDRRRRPVPAYEQELCKQCGLCLQIDCPALTAIDDGFIAIDGNVCVGCNLCTDVCRFGALKKNEA